MHACTICATAVIDADHATPNKCELGFLVCEVAVYDFAFIHQLHPFRHVQIPAGASG